MQWHGFGIGVAVLSLCASATFAQVAVPPAVDPGVQQRRFRELPKPAASAPPIAGPERLAVPSDPDSVRFTLRSVTVEGATVYPQAELATAWSDEVGKEATLGTVFAIAERLTARYRNDGYVLSQVIVPPQDVSSGELRLVAIEGTVSDVQIEGDVDRPRLWEQRSARIEADRPATARLLERELLLSNDLPGAGVRAVLTPGAEIGASTLVLSAASEPVLGYARVGNRGSRFLGPYQGELGVSLNSLLGLYDETTLRVIHTPDDEFGLYAIDHSEQLDSRGTVLRLSFSYTRTHPGATLESLDVEGSSYAGSVGVEHPLLRSRAANVTASLRFDYLDSDNNLVGSTLSTDRIRTLSAGFTADWVDRLEGVSLARFELARGLGILDASDPADTTTNPGASGEFTTLNARMQRLQRIGGGVNLLLTATGQYAFDRLLSSSQFTFGGSDLGHGYDSAELIGDHGVAGAIELQWGLATGLSWLESFQLFSVYDYGVVWLRDPSVSDSRSSGSSAAIGTRLNLTSWLSGEFEVALPLTRPATIDRDDGKREPRFFFAVTARY